MQLFCLEKRRLMGKIIKVYKHLKGGYREHRARLFSMVTSDRTGGTRGNTEGVLNIKKEFFTLRVTEHWQRLPRKVL